MRITIHNHLRRLLAATLAIVMTMVLTVSAFAAETDNTGPDLETIAAMADDAISFSDVPASHTFYAGIMDCAAKGITNGYDDGTFKPTNNVTRAQFCVMLSRAFYPADVQKYNTKVYTDQGWFVPNVRALYSNGILNNTSFRGYFATESVMNQSISRYDMAQLMVNIMNEKGFSATEAQKTEAQKKISDYKDIPSAYQNAVKTVYALGIITGYPNGTFGGSNIMNRGQGCVVIYRMMQYTPANTKPSAGDGTYDDDKTETPATTTPTPVTPVEPAISTATPAAKTLTNGKPATEANVMELLNELKAKYPEGTDFSKGYYPERPSTMLSEVVNSYPYGANTNAGCGGWAALVSNHIFGFDLPARQVSLNQVRPGDIVLHLDANGKLTHVSIATSHAYRPEGAERMMVDITDARNTNEYHIYWEYAASQWDDGYGGSLAIWTRYPD